VKGTEQGVIVFQNIVFQSIIDFVWKTLRLCSGIFRR